MGKHVSISPITRIEGHLAIHLDVEEISVEGKKKYKVREAKCEGEMFRGIEVILRGRDPLDAQQITQRICGVCPISHGLASCFAQEMAYGVKINNNGRLLQNLIQAANYIQSHILHFYHLSALDFVDVTAILKYTGRDRNLLGVKAWVERAIAAKEILPAAPLLPRYEADYIKDIDVNCTLIAHYAEALEMRRLAHEMCAVFGAKVPHSTAIVPGGCCQVPTIERIVSYKGRLRQLEDFIEGVYIPDLLIAASAFPQLLNVGKGYGDLLCYGLFRTDSSGGTWMKPGVLIDGRYEPFDPSYITEDVGQSRFRSGSGLHPSRGETEIAPGKGYSWLKAPRYKGRPMEVGPLARVAVNYFAGTWVKDEVDSVLKSLNLPVEKIFSLLGRHFLRGLEARWIARYAYRMLDELEVDDPPAVDFEIPKSGSGYGLTEAPRGALGHWITIENYKIANYQAVVPTTWNASPRDDRGQPGPIEKAMEEIILENPEHPMEAARLVRSYDPCLACAIH